MTAQRQKQNQLCQIIVLSWLACLVGGATAAGGTNERVVADRFSGLAISGFDPVAYFTDAAPREGIDGVELSNAGTVWRFRSAANRESFRADPDIYAPRFGGHDPVDVARGVARAGRPQIWLIADQRLYLFANIESRNTFAAAVAVSRSAAISAWPEVEALLAQ